MLIYDKLVEHRYNTFLRSVPDLPVKCHLINLFN